MIINADKENVGVGELDEYKSATRMCRIHTSTMQYIDAIISKLCICGASCTILIQLLLHKS